ncbi:hypothetical protein PhaeoP72_01793 [Phaeobacter inhibens]|nr:hypothetical protein PhaeoP10_01748 [Phaeobacter inhibens]AUR03766.1 hypothetical protein PhaeoP72_01793 [Phaeobacter inhibens]
MRYLVWTGVMVLACGCSPGLSSEQFQAKVQESEARSAAEIASYPAATFTVSGMRKRYSGATFLDYSVQHGTQVEYLAPDGRAFLWYPGNTAVVIGQWTVKPPVGRSKYARLCWKYGPLTYNPVAQNRGGEFSCVKANRHILAEEEYTRGDPFDLDGSGIPFPLKKKRQYSMKELSERSGATVVLIH